MNRYAISTDSAHNAPGARRLVGQVSARPRAGRCALILIACGCLHAQVTFDRLLNAGAEPQNWLTYSGNVLGQRHSALKQLSPANVNNLELQGVWQAR